MLKNFQLPFQFGKNLIRIYIFIIFMKSFNFQNVGDDNLIDESKREINEILESIKSSFFNLIINVNKYLPENDINIIFKNQQCRNFILNLFEVNQLMDKFAKKFVRNGFFSGSMEVEEECLENDEHYFLITGNISNDTNKTSVQQNLFIESSSYYKEFCLWNTCQKMYEEIFNIIKNNISEILSDKLGYKTFELEGENYIINNSVYFGQVKKIDFNYITYLSYILIPVGILLFIGTFGSYCCYEEENQKEDDEDKYQNDSFENINNRFPLNESNNSLFSIKKNSDNSNSYKFLKAFNVIENLLLLNKTKEPLSNQTSLIELSTFKLLIIFFILLAENTYTIIKYIDKGKDILPLLKNISFIFIKLGTNSYELYKIICGIIFGFKFISYYQKSKKFNCKQFFRFLSKFIPYLLIFLIIYFAIQFKFTQILLSMKSNIRNEYFSKRMNNCFCQKEFYNIFHPKLNFMFNVTDFNIPQYNACFRPTLFTISEFICYIIILIIMSIFLKLKNKILEIIFFIINIIILGLSYILTEETKHLEYYSISRLFGLSASIANFHLFFPLYFLGFNIGIFYYYNQHQAETFNEININDKSYIPFEYCYKISLFLGRIRGTIKNIILFVCLFLIFCISSLFSNLIKDENKLYIKFSPFLKFLYVYEGILCGVFFCIFITVYLSLSPTNNFRLSFSSEFFVFAHKISFVLFNAFISILRIFHGINILEINLNALNLFRNTLTLFTIINLLSIFFTAFIFYPIKWVYSFIVNGFDYEKYEIISFNE